MNKLFSRFLIIAILLNVLFDSIAVGATSDKEVKPVKNVILMIADGASLPAISLARWYQRTQDPSNIRLHIDPYISGTILTYCSNAPIGDSAPTTSCYMTGIPSIKGFVSTYPYSDGKDDLVPLEASREYSPVMTLMEAARITQSRKTGLVFTCEFSHATPADCTAHSYNRRRKEWIVPQMVHSSLDVVLGGGVALMTPELKSFLEDYGTSVYLNDIEGMRAHETGKMWGLYSNMDMPYDIDRDPKKVPSLAEMAEVAIRHLDRDNEEGFVLMIEGSKVDWAAHANDPVGIATEFLAFDKACKVAIDFAKKDKNTVVIITSDHGNSGLSIGVQGLDDYSGASQDQLFGLLTKVKKTADGIAEILQQVPFEQAAKVFRDEAMIELTVEDLEKLKHVDGYKQSPLLEKERNIGKFEKEALYSGSLSSFVAEIFRKNMYFGFTTHGHTGEDVLLAVYAPEDTHRLVGFNTNIELHEYMKKLLDIEPSMLDLTDEYFVPHDKLFQGLKYVINGNKPQEKQLVVKYKGRTMTIQAFSSEVKINKRVIRTKTPAVYVDKKDLFYINRTLIEELKK
ncbi:alkaline phosphatase [Porphyromonas sp.]|uniref:alkaline phosphatase n=1 Tax=Porphyromonas sp. TaxID=1924944 RepID=UPI0026DCC3EF|nr:alkaline phosphatase [Porphyromonas sp.]MDO4695679.1 alkaline phosphatase [Porphyromonas sp.]MDO4771497.1 alkaline phosphatase [Porphyromonas sp.]